MAERLADDPALTARLGHQARDYVADHFDRNQLARRYIDLVAAMMQPGATS